MNICIYGAGAIGSLFGGLLSKNNNVSLIGRKNHIEEIRKNGLIINGKTSIHQKIKSYDNIQNLKKKPDLIILTVKSFDTKDAALILSKYLSDKIPILTFQNGLNNIDYLLQYFSEDQIIVGITSHGAIFKQPGVIEHTGIGETKIGEMNRKKSKRIKNLSKLLSSDQIENEISSNIKQEIWIKAIVNSSINPLTAIFQCNNGYLLENPILTKLVHEICRESTNIANKNGFNFKLIDMIQKTEQVILHTKKNTSSMLQSIQRNKPTEISAINGSIIAYGRQKNCDISLNNILIKIIKLMYE